MRWKLAIQVELWNYFFNRLTSSRAAAALPL
jgi:hypothetical protein